MRLNSFIAKSGFCSRRKAAEYVKSGNVKVNGIVSLGPWLEVKDSDSVTVGNRIIKVEEYSYIVLNKPKGVTSTVSDYFAERKVVDLVPKRFGRLYPVGRLDKSSWGLLILTNDGELCYRATHPKFQVEKEYAVTVNGTVRRSDIGRILRGIEDEGEQLKVKSAVAVSRSNEKTRLNVIVCEGKKRHVRRIFENLGLEVLDLKRTRIGDLELGDIKSGEFKVFTKDAIYKSVLGKRS